MKNLKNRLSKKILLILASGLIVCGPKVQALPSQGTLDNSASATITTDMANNTMNIAGKGQNNIIDWASFNIDKGERVNFADKNNYLNLVHGVDMSRIYGTISGGNAVYLVNPNGILFADGAALDNVGGFVASTRNISSINKEAFLNDPTNTTAVLGVDNPVMDNKDYYPEDSKYVPKITMADLKLTNVPESATIILDGPGGVILKSKDLLDKVSHVVTRQIGGELGFGYEGGIADLSLTDAEKEKVSLVNGDKYYGKDSVIPYPVRSYKWIRNWDELKAYSNINVNKMLVNDINLTSDVSTINYCNNIFEGLGYSIDSLKINKDGYYAPSYTSEYGLFGQINGDVRNLNIKNIQINVSDRSSMAIGGLAAYTSPTEKVMINNVNVDGNITVDASKYSSPFATIGGLIGSGLKNVEIRNSSSNVNINADLRSGNKIGGVMGSDSSFSTQLYNVVNEGDIKYNQLYTSRSDDNYIGGIVGFSSGNKNYIIGCNNNGNIYINSDTPDYLKNNSIYSIGGIMGAWSAGSDLDHMRFLGDNYNYGKIYLQYPSIESSFYKYYLGEIIAVDKNYTKGQNYELTSRITGENLPSYYIANNIPTGKNISTYSFGIGKRADELLIDYNILDMIGVHDFSVKHTWPPIPPSSGDTGGGPTNPPSGGNTGGGTNNPPSGGNTGGGTNNPPSINDAKMPTIGELLMQQLKNMENGFRDKELDDLLAAMLNGVSARGILEEYNSIVDPRELQKLINNIDSKIDYEEKHADEIRVENLYNSLTSEIENELYNICNTENKKNKEEEFNNLLKVINLDGIPETDKSKILKTVGGMLKEAFDESVSSSKKSIPTDQKGMVEYAYNLISSNIKLDKEVVTGTNGTYSISYNRAMGAIEIKGTGNENSSISLVGNSGATEALSNYTVALAELNTEVWTDVVSQCVDVAGKVVPGKVEKLASQIVLGLMMPEGEIKGQYIEKVNQNISNTVKRDVVNQARDIVSDYIPGGESIIAAADLISEAKGEYSKYMNMSLKEKEADKSYAAFQNVCDQAANLLGVLY